MIKASDIRVNNLILRKGKPFWVDIWTFVQIHQAYVECWNFLEECEGMPLTGERLEGVGFRKFHPDETTWYFKDLHIEFTALDNTFGYSTGSIYVEMKFLHQLQNLFHSLTGQELEINASISSL